MNHRSLIANAPWYYISESTDLTSRALFSLEGFNFCLYMPSIGNRIGKMNSANHYIGADWVASFKRKSPLRIRGNVERAEEELMLAYLTHL